MRDSPKRPGIARGSRQCPGGRILGIPGYDICSTTMATTMKERLRSLIGLFVDGRFGGGSPVRYQSG